MPSSWPLILAGPILRRVEPRSVSVWVALSDARTVRLSLYLGLASAGSGSGPMTAPPLTSATAATRRIGARLHLALVTVALAEPAAPLLPGTLYSYNLSFTGGASAEDLKTLRLLHDDNATPPTGRPHRALGYIENQLPSFAMPPVALTDLRVVHGSCRKIHGQGPDAMAAVDHIIAATRDAPDRRPHQLFLTGDQIYADEVPVELSSTLTAVGTELLGGEPTAFKEQLLTNAGPRVVDQATFPAGGRQTFVTTDARFTTDAGSNHLLSFGEYAAMYLLSWSNVAWPATLPTVPGDGATGERPHVERFRTALPAVRRALANVPTYMILDDHEITDDVYLSLEWRQRVLASPAGRDIVRNGFVAYGLFQGWGNDPARFAAAGSPGRRFLDEAVALYPAGAATWPVATAVGHMEDLLDMGPPPTGTGPDPRVAWHYSVRGPKHVAYVLDTRTRRSYDSLFASPGLLSRDALQAQIPGDPPPVGEPPPFAGPGDPRDAGIDVAFVISPAPVLGLAAVEELAQMGVIKAIDMKAAFQRKKLVGGYEKDAEPWSYQPLAFEALLRRLAPLGRVVFLSGDVHYASSASMSYWDDAGNEARFAQFTSSALKNREGLRRIDLLSQPAVQVLFGRVGYPAARNGWLSRTPIPVRVPTSSTVPRTYRAALDAEPVALSVFGWPSGTTADPPDWAWRIEVVADVRPDDTSPDARPVAIRSDPIAPDVVPATPGDALPRVAVRHARALRRQTHRRVVFTSNVGVVRFTTGPPNVTVREDLYSYLPDPDDGERVDPGFPLPDAYTAHVVSLAPTGTAPPRIPA